LSTRESGIAIYLLYLSGAGGLVTPAMSLAKLVGVESSGPSTRPGPNRRTFLTGSEAANACARRARANDSQLISVLPPESPVTLAPVAPLRRPVRDGESQNHEHQQ